MKQGRGKRYIVKLVYYEVVQWLKTMDLLYGDNAVQYRRLNLHAFR